MTELIVDGHTLHCEVSGNGEPAVLLHGGGSNARQWNALFSDLSGPFAFIAPDLYGHGSSPAWRGAFAPALADYAAIVDVIASRLDGPFHLVGHSHGGAVAITYALRNPSALSSLTLIEPTLMHLLRETGDPQVWREAHTLGSKHIAAVEAGEAARIADEFLPYWIGDAA